MKFLIDLTKNTSKRKLLVYVFSTVITIYSVFTFFYFPAKFETQAISMMENKANSIVELAAVNLSSAMYFEDYETIDDMLNRILPVESILGIVVFGRNDSLIAQKLSNVTKPNPQHFSKNDSRVISGSELLIVNQNIEFNNELVGKIVISFTLREINKEVSRIKHAVTMLSGLMFIIGLLAVLWISSAIRKPLSKLVKVFSEIAAGNFDIRAKIDNKDEFGNLANSFNSMVDKLEETQSELETINKNLEIMVEERTNQYRREVEERKAAQREVLELNKTLENRVEERTSQLQQALNDLKEEIKVRKKVERKLAFSDKVLKRAGALVFVVDDKANIVYSSEYSNVLLDKNPDEFIGINWADFFLQNDELAAEKKNYIEQVARGEIKNKQHPLTTMVKRSNNTIKWIQWQEMKGEKSTIIIVGHDVTELVEAEAKLKQANQEVAAALEKEKELNELKTRFVSMISHEYRTPLTVILTSSSLLTKLYEMQDREGFDKFINKITVSVNTMTKLLEDVLLIGQSDTGSIKLNYKKISLLSVIDEIIEDTKQSYPKEQIFNIINNDNIHNINTDETLFKQILSNLITNASKYSSYGSLITIETKKSHSSMIITVEDNGIGISEEDQKHLFTLFHRGSNVGVVSGTGLGLSIVKRFVDALDGKINLESEVGKGTKFSIELPIIDFQ